MKRILAFIMSVIMISALFPGITVIAADEIDRSDPDDVAAFIFKRIEVGNDPVLKEGLKLYKSGDSLGALTCYRNYFIEKLRSVEAGYYPGLVPTSENMMFQADVVCGLKTIEEYSEKFPNITGFDNVLGGFGSPYVERKINWLAANDKPVGSAMYVGEGKDTSLAWIGMMSAAYYNSGGNKIYMDKFFQVAEDFAINCKKDIEAYEASTPEIPTSKRGSATWQWPGIHINNERTAFLRACLIQFCKLLPAEGETGIPVLSSWNDIVKPFGKANPEYYDMIDPVKLATITVCMIEDVIPMLLLGFRADIAANQRNSAAKSCALMLAMYSEFTNLAEIKDECGEYLLNIWGMMYQDGTYLEQSLNYNDDEATNNLGLVNFYKSMGVEEAWMTNFSYSTELYYRFRDAYLSNAVTLPKVGNGGDSLLIPEIWKDDKALEEYKAFTGYNYDTDPLPFDSVFFPWGGYACLRSGWGIRDDMTLGFYNPETSGTGHASLMKNAVWLTAYGRPLIQSGEGNIYWASSLPEEEQDDYQKYNEYFGESSTLKGSTIMVNNKHQRKDLPGTTSRTTTMGQPVVKARFLDGNKFDYIDGNFACGYTGGGVRIDDAKHVRQNFFVRDADVWIIVDTMNNEGSSVYEYSQIWRFPAKSDDIVTPQGYTFTGFLNEEVVVDDENNSIKTQDEGDVNLFMSHFSNEQLTYKKYYGSKGDKEGEDGVFRGWSARGIQGQRVPAADVYVNWSDKNSKNSQVMTFAMPSKTENTPYKEIKDISNAEAGVTGFELVTNDDKKVTSLSSSTPAYLTAAGITAKAKNLVVTENGSEISGVLLDCESIVTENGEVTSETTDFEFVVKDGKIEIVNPITEPQSFGWVDTEDGKYYPRYDCYTMAESDELELKFNSMVDGMRIIKYSESSYVVDKVRDDLNEVVSMYQLLENVAIASEREAMVDTIDKYRQKVIEVAQFYNKNEFNKKIATHFKNFSEMMIALAPNGSDENIKTISDRYLASAAALNDSNYDITDYLENIDSYRECAKGFSDISGSWAKNDIEYMVEQGLINGVSDTRFAPDSNMTRAQMTAILMRILGIEGKYSGEFSDISPEDWFADGISAAVKNGIVSGDNGLFRPNDPITREEVAKMISLASGFTVEKVVKFADEADISEWAAEFVAAVSENSIMNGYPDGTFKPKSYLTRAEGTVMLKRVYEKRK